MHQSTSDTNNKKREAEIKGEGEEDKGAATGSPPPKKMKVQNTEEEIGAINEDSKGTSAAPVKEEAEDSSSGNANTEERDGKRKDKKKNRNKKNKNRKNRNNSGERDSRWVDRDEQENALFEKYYKTVLFNGKQVKDHERSIQSEEEWNTFIKTLRTKLPITFRISNTNPEFASIVRRKIEEEFVPKIAAARVSLAKLEAAREPIPDESLATRVEVKAKEEESGGGGEEVDEKEKIVYPVEPPKPIDWYPDGLGWHISTSKTMFRKIPELNDLRKYVMTLTDYGYISRQEAVSMIPPLFFDINPSDKILDMCAAPGSKTAQLMEALCSSAQKQDKPITGFVVANDNDMKRCYLLATQLQRLSSMIPHTMITVHDATQYPNFQLPDEGTGEQKRIKFDKILCDVMCSGDGTLRKSPDMWKRWKPALAWGVHSFQIQCAMQGFNLLNDGGTLVYSTCSLNPIEDEAVVAEILRRSKGRLELVDCSQRFPNLKYSPGITNWPVMDGRGRFLESSADIPEDTRMTATMFPPTAEEAKAMNLHYGMRMLPHKHDTGGFFIAVLRKRPAEGETEEKEKEVNVGTSSTSITTTADINPAEEKQGFIKSIRGRAPRLERYASPSEAQVDKIYEFFGIADERLPRKNLFVRIDEHNKQASNKRKLEESKKIYYVSDAVQKIVDKNNETGKWKIGNAGMRVFEHYPSPLSECQYRISQEGVELLHDFISKDRIITLDTQDFKTFLQNTHMGLERITDEAARKHANQMNPGSCVVALRQTEQQIKDRVPTITVAGFRSVSNVMRFCKNDRAESIFSFLDFQ